MDNPDKSPNSPKKEELKSYLKYSGMAFQMIGVIGVAVWGGIKLDKYFNLSFPWFMVVLSVLGFIGSIIAVIKSLPKN